MAEKFAKAVIRKYVEGKLPSGSKVNGTEINSLYAGGFHNHGPDRIPSSPLFNNVLRLFNTIYENPNKLPNIMNSHIVSVTPSQTDLENRVLTILFFQDAKQVDSRGYCTRGQVSMELPNGVMTEFLGEISKNPDLLEDFYQKTFVGLDSQGGLPGMRRIKANGFFIISGTKLEEAGRVEKYDTRAVGTFFSSLEKHQYQQGPYGTGDAFQPK